jgi:restriction system protein
VLNLSHNGSELSRLMLQYGVGVRTDRTVEVKRIDLDYFEEAEVTSQKNQ